MSQPPHFLLAFLPELLLPIVLGTAGTLLAGLFVCWLILGRGPKRCRRYYRAQRLLQQGAWQAALEHSWEARGLGRLSPMWEGRLRNLEGECHRTAGESALREHRYEDSLQHYLTAAQLLDLNVDEARGRIIETMLAESRRLFATSATETAVLQSLLERLLQLQPACPEAMFWRGMCHVREGRIEPALEVLRQAKEESAGRYLDPTFYLGALLLREGRAPEAVRHLAEANRLDASNPFVGWQLGTGILASGGDPTLAVRALQRAAGPQGLTQWLRRSDRLWAEAMPEGRSFVRRLAEQYPYQCPVFGNDVAAMLRAANFALAQAHYRTGNFAESANLFARLLQDAAPTLPVLRGLGLALARLERYDEAFKHLRSAHEQENPRNPYTAGYLALCGALGKPSRPEDRPSNVAWAVRLIAKFHLPGDLEWAGLCSRIFHEARLLGVPVTVDEQRRLCEVLRSVDATDPMAAAAYDHLAATVPQALQPEHAWLYCRAAQQHGISGPRDLELFAVTFRNTPAARDFFARRQWDFDEVEVAYLERWSLQQPGRFPDVLGTDYPARGEQLLLERSRRQEEAGRLTDALTTAGLLQKLAPRCRAAHDRLAYLHHRLGDVEQAVQALVAWHQQHPDDYLPLVRRAVIEAQSGKHEERRTTIQLALQRTRGPLRARVAFLGARLALASGGLPPPEGNASEAEWLLQQCLRDQPNHTDALWCLAAVRALRQDERGLAALAAVMDRPEVHDGRFHYLAAVCHLAAGNFPSAIKASRRAAQDTALADESQYLAGCAHLHMEDREAATRALEWAAQAEGSPSADHARARLGLIGFQDGNYDQAVRWWSGVAPARRAAWKLDEALRGTVFLSAVRAYQTRRFEQAADRCREAGRLGCRDRRLGPLMTLALFKAGQRLLYTSASSNGTIARTGDDTEVLQSYAAAAVGLLEQCLKAGCEDSNAAYLLALACKRQGNFREARNALRKISTPDANVWLQMGLLSLKENQLAQAEQEFARAFEMDPGSFAVCRNLALTRLSLGQMKNCAALVPRIVELATDPDEQRLFTLLHALLQTFEGQPRDPRLAFLLAEMTADHEQRLVDLARTLGQLDTVSTLLRALSTARPNSLIAQQAYQEAILLQAKRLLDRCDWVGVEKLLGGESWGRGLSRAAQVAQLNLLGCAACLGQDFKGAVKYFAAALKLAPNDARICQNQALAHEWQGSLDTAEPFWNRWLELLSPKLPAPPEQPDYIARLEQDALCRLSAAYAEKQRWPGAIGYLERALRLQPGNLELLERLFHLYTQARRPEDARQTLARLKQLRPGEPQFELYELDLGEIKDIRDVERVVRAIGRIMVSYPDDPRVEERAISMVGNVVPLMSRLCDQLTEQLNKVMEQVRSLPNYQINWSAVHDIMRDLKREFQHLRRITGLCLPLVNQSQHQQIIRDLSEYIDRKIEFCKRWEGG